MPAEPLTGAQRAALTVALAPFASRIERVDLYGSRARGTHRPGSDIDLILFGDFDDAALAAVQVALETSDLSVDVDVRRDGDVVDPVFREELQRSAKTLFRREDLLA